MNKARLVITLFLCACFSFLAIAQEEKWEKDSNYTDGNRHREFLINFTPLISQFVPFNASTLSKFNLFDFETRRFKNGKGTHFGLGVNLDFDNPSVQGSSFYVRFGYIKKSQLSARLHFTRSWDIDIIAEEADNRGVPIGKLGFSGFAASYSAGLEYDINRHLAVSTEGILFLGLLNLDFGSPKIMFIPPVGLYLHVKL